MDLRLELDGVNASSGEIICSSTAGVVCAVVLIVVVFK
jgi:hypothetical protein